MVDQVPGAVAVAHIDVATEKRGPPTRVPDVLVGGECAPHPGQLDLGAGAEHAVRDPAHAHRARGIVHLVGALVGAEAGRALGVAGVEADHVAAGQVELGAGRHRPAQLIVGMAVVHAVGREPVGAARFVERAADAGEAPGLVDAQVGDDVRHAEAVLANPLCVEGAVAEDDAVQGEEASAVLSMTGSGCGRSSFPPRGCRRSRCRTGRCRPTR